MGAGSLICIASREEIAQQATAGIGNTHCSVNKALDLHIIRDSLSNLADLLKRKLTCGNDTLCAETMPEQIRSIVRVVRLCTDMNLHLRKHALCDLKDTRIRDDQCIRTNLFQLLKIHLHTLKILIVCENICRHIDFRSMLMCKLNSCLHVLSRKVLCLCTQSKCLTTDIYGIRAVNHSRLQHVQTTCRNQQLCLSHDFLLISTRFPISICKNFSFIYRTVWFTPSVSIFLTAQKIIFHATQNSSGFPIFLHSARLHPRSESHLSATPHDGSGCRDTPSFARESFDFVSPLQTETQ